MYDITQKISPANSFNFNGEITILIDSNCISAGDSFASTMYGTMPDVYLMQIPYPSELSNEVLVKDDWINWSLNH